MSIYLYGAFLIALALLVIILFLKKPKYQKFTSMKLYDVIWRWKWKQKKIITLHPYCPTCKEELIYDDEHSKSTKNLNEKFTFLICNHCNKEQKGRIQGGDRNFILNLVKREIFRQINTKEYEQK